ncbi:hypothetical protein FKM82_017901 [Ascaphus truei]
MCVCLCGLLLILRTCQDLRTSWASHLRGTQCARGWSRSMCTSCQHYWGAEINRMYDLLMCICGQRVK